MNDKERKLVFRVIGRFYGVFPEWLIEVVAYELWTLIEPENANFEWFARRFKDLLIQYKVEHQETIQDEDDEMSIEDEKEVRKIVCDEAEKFWKNEDNKPFERGKRDFYAKALINILDSKLLNVKPSLFKYMSMLPEMMANGAQQAYAKVDANEERLRYVIFKTIQTFSDIFPMSLICFIAYDKISIIDVKNTKFEEFLKLFIDEMHMFKAVYNYSTFRRFDEYASLIIKTIEDNFNSCKDLKDEDEVLKVSAKTIKDIAENPEIEHALTFDEIKKLMDEEHLKRLMTEFDE